MNTALWIITGLLTVAFVTGAAGQLLLTKERYRAVGPSQHWVDDFSAGKVKAIGTIKLIGAVGLIAPALTGIATFLSPLAACGLMLFMAGAATTRFRRGEWAYMAGDISFILAFAFIAWGRFALAPYA